MREPNAMRSGGIVVAADDKDLQFALREPDEKFVEQADRLRGGNGFVVDVPGDDDGVRLFGVGDLQNAFQDVFLLLKHGVLIDAFPEVQIGQVQQFHGVTS